MKHTITFDVTTTDTQGALALVEVTPDGLGGTHTKITTEAFERRLPQVTGKPVHPKWDSDYCVCTQCGAEFARPANQPGKLCLWCEHKTRQ